MIRSQSMILLIIFLSSVKLAYSKVCAEDESDIYGNCVKKSCYEQYCQRLKQEGCNFLGNPLINFEGLVEWTGYSAQVVIKFPDQSSDGTMNRDNPSSCIMDGLYTHDNETNVDSLIQTTITSSYDCLTAKRVWSMSLDSKSESQPGITIYTGSYSLKLFLINQPQIVYQFQYTLEVNCTTKSLINSSYKDITYNGMVLENKVNSTLQFCYEPTCSSPQNTAELFVKQKFWLLQKVTTPELRNMSIELQSVFFKSIGILKKVRMTVENSKKGQLILGSDVSFAYDAEITIEVNSTFSKENSANTLQLNQLQIVSKAVTKFYPLGDETTIATIASSLEWCNEPTCANPTVAAPKLYLNQRFWLLQKITTPEFTSFKLELVSVTFQGFRLRKRVKPASVVSSSGQVIIGLFFSFAYDASIIIYVDSKLELSRRRVLQRILAESTGSVPDPAHAMQNTGDLGCIKLKESDTDCPTCKQLEDFGITCSISNSQSGSVLLFALALAFLLLFI